MYFIELDVICVEAVANPLNLVDTDSPNKNDDDKQQFRFVNTLRYYCEKGDDDKI